MATTAPSKFAENQFSSATAGSFPLMSELLLDTVPRATNVTAGIADFDAVLTTLTASAAAWHAGAVELSIAEAALPGRTFAFDDKLASLTRKPDADTNSTLESWDLAIRSQVAYQGPVYMSLLPRGRETVTTGTRAEQLDGIEQLSVSLQAQTSKPALVTLGTTVAAFCHDARNLRNAQTDAKSSIEVARTSQEALRVTAAAALYALVGQGMVVWSGNPALVDNLFDVNILRNPPQTVPAPPLDTTWNPDTRTLSTTAPATGTTRVEAWRLGPGGTPELLQTGTIGSSSIVIPAAITFIPGHLYQLWLVALNSKGKSAPGPVQNWTAA